MPGTTLPRSVLPTPAQVRQLPRFRHATIGPEYLDTMGHMNIRWYMATTGWPRPSRR